MGPDQRAQLDGNAGWILLLPPPQPGNRVLCIELNQISNAEALAYWHEEVTALTAQAGNRCLRRQFRDGQLVDENEVPWQPGTALPFDDGSFAIVVCRLVGGQTVTRREDIASLVPEAMRLLVAGGCLYVDANNPWSYTRLRSPRGDEPRLSFFPSTWRRECKRAGFESFELHPYLVERGVVTEVLPAEGYQPSQEGRLERLKSVLLGRIGARVFAAAHGMIASRRPAHESILNTLPGSAARAGLSVARGTQRFQRFKLGAAKSFIEFADGTSTPRLIYVVPSHIDFVNRRRTELAALAQLQNSTLSVKSLLPAIARETEHCGRPIFVYEAFKGQTIDSVTPHFDASLGAAFDVLRAFNRESLRVVNIRHEDYRALVGDAVQAAGERYPPARPALSRLDTALRNALIGSDTRVVWFHGDYKLENLIFRSTQAVAIIDWELASPIGLPLCDLLYLICYAEITRGSAPDVLQVIETDLLSGTYPDAARGMVESYVAEFGLTFNQIDFAIAVFVMHHIGRRFTYDQTDAAILNRLTAATGRLADRIERLSA